MSEIKTKEELVRMDWVTELRRQGHRQCTGEMFYGAEVCALGLLAETSGLGRVANAIVARSGGFSPIGKRAGLTKEQTDAVWVMNDNGCTFAQIANAVESWF